MLKNIKLKDVLIFAGVIAVILLMVFKKETTPIYKVAPTKEIETRVEGKETEIKTFETRIVQDKKIVSEISDQLDQLKIQLNQYRNERDTFQIVQIQDTLINALTDENIHLRSIVNNQDSIIVAQRYIINSKDTLIAIGKHDLKKVKRQRNISLLFNGILTGVAIFK